MPQTRNKMLQIQEGKETAFYVASVLVNSFYSIKLEQKEHQELMNVLKQPAFTHEEKYKILEARDKLVRLYTTKNTDMQKVEATVGTCPDMCPEKERIMREIQHQVISLYYQYKYIFINPHFCKGPFL